jgi:hypothetical protein
MDLVRGAQDPEPALMKGFGTGFLSSEDLISDGDGSEVMCLSRLTETQSEKMVRWIPAERHRNKRPTEWVQHQRRYR